MDEFDVTEGEDFIFGRNPIGSETIGQKPVPAPEGFEGVNFGKSKMTPITQKERLMETYVKPLTPRAMGRYLEERMLPRIEEEKAKAEKERQKRIPAAQAEVGSLSPSMQKALAAAGSAADAATMGIFPYIPAAGAKIAGYAGVPGYERYSSMPITDIKKAAQKKVEAASTLQPGYGISGTVGGTLLGAKFLPPVLPKKPPVVSGAATGATYGTASGYASEGSIPDAIKSGVISAVGGAVAAPVLEKAVSFLIRKATSTTGRPIIDEYGKLSEEAVDTARKAGLTDNQILNLGPHLVRAFEERGFLPSAAREAQFREFGLTPTRGMVMNPSRAKTKQLEREKEFGVAQGTAAGAPTAAEIITGGAPRLSIRDALDDAVAAGNKAAQSLKSGYQRAYRSAENVPGSFDRESISNLGDKIMKGFGSNPKTLSIYSNEFAQKAAADLDKVLGAKIPTETPGVSIIHTTFQGVEGARQTLNRNLERATNQADRFAIRSLITAFDRRIEDNINAGLFSGDRGVLDAWKLGRKLYSQYQNKFGIKKTGEDAGRLFKSIVDGNRNADEVGNLMFNINNSGSATLKSQAGKYFRELQRALGPNSPELSQIKNSYIQKIVQPVASGKEGALLPKDFSTVAKNINDMITGRGSSFSRSALSDIERQALLRYADVMKIAAQEVPDITRKKFLEWTKTAAMAAPSVAGIIMANMGWPLMNLDPKIATGLSALAGIPAIGRFLRGTATYQRSLANRPPPSTSREYRTPSIRTGIPLVAQATPTLQTQLEDVFDAEPRYTGGRIERKAGGRISPDAHADRLVAAAESAKRRLVEETKPLLNEDDNTIAKALEIANQHV